MAQLGAHSNPLYDSTADEPSMALTLGRNVRLLRERQHINKTRFAAMVGIGRPLLNKIENGSSNIRLSLVQELADALEANPRELLFDNRSLEPKPIKRIPPDWPLNAPM